MNHSEINSISHFLEHMLFKGTSTPSHIEINGILDSKGIDFNAFTYKNMMTAIISNLFQKKII